MTLHCLYDPDSHNAQLLRRVAREGDVILLLGAATALARRGHLALGAWTATGADIYALKEDLRLHGVDNTDESIGTVDYEGWVALAAQQSRQLLWR